jgi:hypothetical protein
MNARIDFTMPPLRIVNSRESRTVVNVWGFDMDVGYEFEAGEPAVINDVTGGHPGSPDNAKLTSCRIKGVEIIEMLKPDQIERVEEAILQALGCC